MNRQTVETELKEYQDIASLAHAVLSSPETSEQYEEARLELNSALERIKELKLILKYIVK